MYMVHLTQHEFNRQIDNGCSTVLLPIGMLEGHGDHIALGTDILIPREFVRRLEAEVGEKIMMAPEIVYGHSFALAPFRVTIDVPQNVFTEYVVNIGVQFLQQGFRHVILFNGHGGNIPSLGAYILMINWWLDYRTTITQFAPSTDHGGENETSCVLAIDESLVEMEYAHNHKNTLSSKIKCKDIGLKIFPNATSRDTLQATATKGEQIYAALLPEIRKAIEELWTFSSN
ncbi:MAG: creatininase family protein [Acidibacillus sp.]|nr:creatininase family protein [Acidibacillus sp.]